MLKRVVSYLIFAVIVVVVFNLLDLIFDRLIFHVSFTFDTLSNILLPLVIAAVILVYLAMYKRFVK